MARFDKIPDLLKYNEWPTREFTLVFIFLWCIYIIYFILNYASGFCNFPTGLFGFLVLTFIPGFSILRLLKIHGLPRSTNMLLVIGMSLFVIMAFGLLINFILPILGIPKPFSTIPAFICFNILLFALLIMNICIGKHSACIPNFSGVQTTPLLLVIFIIPALTILGTYLVTYTNSSSLIVIILIICSLSPLAILFSKHESNEIIAPLVILSVSVSLLFHASLVTNFLWGFDVFFQFYSTVNVLQEGIWDPNIFYTMHSLPLIAILAPIYSILCRIDPVWCYKIVFPFIFSLVPLGLYVLYKNIDWGRFCLNGIAMLSPFFFMFFYGFYKDISDKQHIAEFFFILILITSTLNISKINQKFLIICFMCGLLFSHYGLSYICIISFIGAYIGTYIVFYSYHKKPSDNTTSDPKGVFNFMLITYFVALVFFWHMYTVGGVVFENVVYLGERVADNIAELFIPDDRSGLKYFSYSSPSLMWSIYKIIHVLLQASILCGLIVLLRELINKSINITYIHFIIFIFYLLLILQITLTFGMGFDRIYQITLTLLSPLAYIGITSIIVLGLKFCNYIFNTIYFNKSFSAFAVAIFLAIFLLFNSGTIFKLSGDVLPTYSIALDINSGWPVYNESEYRGLLWIKSQNVSHNMAVFNIWGSIKSRDGLIASSIYPSSELVKISPSSTNYDFNNTYMYIGTVSQKRVQINQSHYINLDESKFYNHTLSSSSIIYNSGHANIYFLS